MAAHLQRHAYLNLHRHTHTLFSFFGSVPHIEPTPPLRQADKMGLLRWNDLPIEQEDTVLRATIFHWGLTPSPEKS